MNNNEMFVLYLSKFRLSEKTIENYVNALNSMESNHIHSFIDEKFDLFQKTHSSMMESILEKYISNS